MHDSTVQHGGRSSLTTNYKTRKIIHKKGVIKIKIFYQHRCNFFGCFQFNTVILIDALVNIIRIGLNRTRREIKIIIYSIALIDN